MKAEDVGNISNIMFKTKMLDTKVWKAPKGDNEYCKRYYGEMLGYVMFVYFNNSGREFQDQYIVEKLLNIKFYHPFGKNSGGAGPEKKCIVVPPWTVGFTVLKFGMEQNLSHFVKIRTSICWK